MSLSQFSSSSLCSKFVSDSLWLSYFTSYSYSTDSHSNRSLQRTRYKLMEYHFLTFQAFRLFCIYFLVFSLLLAPFRSFAFYYFVFLALFLSLFLLYLTRVAFDPTRYTFKPFVTILFYKRGCNV